LRRGFTLIEIMIVVAIVALLAAVLAVSISGAFGRSDAARAKATLEILRSNIESFKARWGVAPPSNLADLAQLVGFSGLAAPNTSNEGIETLILALRSRREGGPYLDAGLFADDAIRANLDFDSVVTSLFASEFLDIPEGSSNELFEFVDPWGNPFVYLNMREVEERRVNQSVTLLSGEQVRLDPTILTDRLRHPVTGDYPADYVLWSFGPDGINDYGRGDDITSWPKYD
jgi:prepilin-type N-terminal cleavage/methylation domain-containing protein